MAGSDQSVRARAYAKVNLALSVGPAEPPRGYHPIASWFACVDLHDDLWVTRQSADRASAYRIEWASDAPRPSPIDWQPEQDLAVRAHRALEQQSGQALPLHLVLTKRIPVGGGLGGGSSDAAAMLRAVDALFDLRTPEQQLHRLAMTLGSDVAFFVDCRRGLDQPARPALVEGYGAELRRVDQAGGAVVLLLPPFGCPTGAVYRAYDHAPRPLRAEQVRTLIARAAGAGRVESAELFNDLAGPACAVEPRLAAVLGVLRSSLGVPVHVTGSGSTMFAFAESDAEASRMATRAREACPGVFAAPTRLI